MTLLFLTQKVDKDDALLGTYHAWIAKLAEKIDRIEVVCLEKGRAELPANVSVFSLGKEHMAHGTWRMAQRIRYAFRFLRYAICDTPSAVFVHMNQEYVLLAGWYWRLRGVPVFFWRNHPDGNWMTRLAYRFSTKVFYTSPSSYSARHAGAKGVQMPVGIDTELFKADEAREAEKLTKLQVVSVGRISPVKNVHVLVEAARILTKRGIDFTLDIYGDPVDRVEDREYFKKLKFSITNFQLPINFQGSIPNSEVPEAYAGADVSVNVTKAGSMDKAIFEAMACEVPVIFSNPALAEEFPELSLDEGNAETLADKLAWFAGLSRPERAALGAKCRQYVVEHHSLAKLIDGLMCMMTRIETERLILFPISMSDAREIFSEFTEEITMHMFPSSPKKIEETEAFVRKSLADMAAGKSLTVVIRKRDGEFLGGGGIGVEEEHPELGIWIKKSAHGHHYGREAIGGLVHWAEKHLAYDYLSYPVMPENIPSKKIPESLGGVLSRRFEKANARGVIREIVEYRIYPRK